MIIIILFYYVFKKMIIIAKRDINDLNIFYIISVMKIKIAFIMILKLFEFDVVDLKIIIDEMCGVVFMKGGFLKKRRNYIMIA